VRTPAPPPIVRAWPWLKAERIEAAWQSYNAMLEQSEWLDDDLVPYMPVSTGTEIFAEALGCAVYRPDDNNPFAIPFVHTPAMPNVSRSPGWRTPRWRCSSISPTSCVVAAGRTRC